MKDLPSGNIFLNWETTRRDSLMDLHFAVKNNFLNYKLIQHDAPGIRYSRKNMATVANTRVSSVQTQRPATQGIKPEAGEHVQYKQSKKRPETTKTRLKHRRERGI